MRLGIKGKQIAYVTAIVGMAVVILSLFNVARLARVVLNESESRGRLLANAIFHRAREVVSTERDPMAGLRTDPGLRAILEASIYGESVTDATIVDADGVVIAASDPALEGAPLATRRNLGALVAMSLYDQLGVIYSRDGQTLEVSQPMVLGDRVFGSIRIGVSTLLMRRELDGSIRPAIIAALFALGVAVFVAALLAQLFLRPIHVIRSGLTRLGKGEFGVTLDLPPGDEFGELGSFFNSVSQQLSADRSRHTAPSSLSPSLEGLDDAVALVGPGGDLLFANPSLAATLSPSVVGKPLAAAFPDGHPLRRLVEDTIATKRPQGPVRLETGEAASVDGVSAAARLLTTHAITNPNGELTAVLLVSKNLAYLSRVQSTLAYSRKLVALGRLTAGIAHEVKNPLNAMMIHLELLRTKIRTGLMVPSGAEVVVGASGLGLATSADVPPPVAQAALEHVRIIEGEIRRLDEVVQGFLKFTRPEDLKLQPVLVTALLRDLLPVVSAEAEKTGVRVIVDCPPGVPAVSGDEAMLRQVFLNLAINACQAMPHGGVLRVTASAAAGGRVDVKVEDTGVGIDPDHLGKIFDLYFTTKDHGTGIGLSMVYRIVQLHDGEVEVQSTPGRGTTFRVTLPRAVDA